MFFNKKKVKPLEEELELIRKELDVLKKHNDANLSLITFLTDELVRVQKELTRSLQFIMEDREWILRISDSLLANPINPSIENSSVQEPKKDYLTLPVLYKKDPNKSN